MVRRKGIDPTRTRARRASSSRKSLVAIGICVVRVGPPYSTAISRFKALTTLTAGASKPIRVGGYPGVSFHAAVQGEHYSYPASRRYVTFCPVGSRFSSTCAERRCSCGSRSPPVRKGRQQCADSCGR